MWVCDYPTLYPSLINTWHFFIESLVQDCGNSSVLAMKLLQSYTKPSM